MKSLNYISGNLSNEKLELYFLDQPYIACDSSCALKIYDGKIDIFMEDKTKNKRITGVLKSKV